MGEPFDHDNKSISDSDAEQEDPPFRPLTPEEARAWKARNPSISPWRIVAAQAVVGLGCALVAWGLTQRGNVVWSALCGAAVVVIPGAVLAWGMARRADNPAAAAAGFMLWELMKIALAVTLLVLAVKVVPDLSWPALLVSMVVCMKMGWLVLLSRRQPLVVATKQSKRV